MDDSTFAETEEADCIESVLCFISIWRLLKSLKRYKT
jgi:hypothetical protein